jgi:hypothetical protein
MTDQPAEVWQMETKVGRLFFFCKQPAASRFREIAQAHYFRECSLVTLNLGRQSEPPVRTGRF